MVKVVVLSVLFVFTFVDFVKANNIFSEKFKNYIHDRVDSGENKSIIVGIYNNGERSFYAYGLPYDNSPYKVSENSIYQIGSVTKVFTSLLFAQLSHLNEITLEDKVGHYFPEKYNQHLFFKNITFRDLLSHTSGLPRLPTNLKIMDVYNPYEGYKKEQLESYISSLEKNLPQLGTYGYSNLGYAILGYVISNLKVKTFNQILKDNVLYPLHLENTFFYASRLLPHHVTKGHVRGKEVPDWDFEAFQAAGGMYSSASDLLKFIIFNIQKDVLKKAIETTHKIYVDDTNIDGLKVALGWHILSDVFYHNGETGGYASFIGFHAKKNIGVVVLTNSKRSVDDIGFSLLFDNYKLPPILKSIVIDKDELNKFVGRYYVNEDMDIIIGQYENILTFRVSSGGEEVKILPYEKNKFFVRGQDILIDFQEESDAVRGLVFKFQNQSLEAQKK